MRPGDLLPPLSHALSSQPLFATYAQSSTATISLFSEWDFTFLMRIKTKTTI